MWLIEKAKRLITWIYAKTVDRPYIPSGKHTVLYLQMPKYWRENIKDTVAQSYILDEEWAVKISTRDKKNRWSESIWKS